MMAGSAITSVIGSKTQPDRSSRIRTPKFLTNKANIACKFTLDKQTDIEHFKNIKT